MQPSTPSISQQQFRLPSGWLGRLAGWYMSTENRSMNRMAVEWLKAGPQDDVLEIGSGPGHGIELLVRRTAARSITGLDPSAEMLDQAASRNSESVASGRVRLLLGSVDALPFADGTFSKVIAVSNFHVWPSLDDGVQEIRRVLADHGRLVVCLRRALESPWPWSSPGVNLETLREDQTLLAANGFDRVQMATRKRKRRSTCLVADVAGRD